MTDIAKLSRAAQEAHKALQEQNNVVDALANTVRESRLDALKLIHENSAVRRLLQDAELQEMLMRAAEGPLAELRRAGVFDLSSPLQQEMQRVQQMMAEFEARFTLPEVGTAGRLIAQFCSSPAAEAIARYAENAANLEKAIQAMRAPWLDSQEALRSVTSFAELYGIGSMVARLPTFDDRVVSALRVDLGDWRDPITWPENIFTDLVAREDFYVERGFDPALTDLPAPAFQERLEISGLGGEPPPLVAMYGAPVPPSDDEDEEQALARTNQAHNWLLRLESQLRKFIDDQMSRSFGPDWPKHRLPNGMYDQWWEKKRTRERQGKPERPLIAYSDFTDYQQVICRKDNWREVFEPHFGRQESVRETFQRLHLVRLDTMHARPITQDDELLLHVETRRLYRVITR